MSLPKYFELYTTVFNLILSNNLILEYLRIKTNLLFSVYRYTYVHIAIEYNILHVCSVISEQVLLVYIYTMYYILAL